MMKCAEVESLQELRRVAAKCAADLAAEFSLLGKASNLSDDLKLARCELDMINSLLGIIDLRFLYCHDFPLHDSVIATCEAVDKEEHEAILGVHKPVVPTPAPRSRGRPRKNNSSKAESPSAKAVLAMELESGVVIELPSVSEAVRVCDISYGLIAKMAALTSSEDWARGAEYLANAAMRHAKGWAVAYKENLEVGNDK